MVNHQKDAFLIAASFLISSSYAQNSTCTKNQPFNDGVNATGSHSMPGFQVNSSYPSSTWTWSAFVGIQKTGPFVQPDTTTVITGFGLSTSPVQNLTDAALPYQGCVMTLTLSPDVLYDSTHDNGDCTATFGSACVAEIISTANSSASAISGPGAGGLDQCGQILSHITSLSLDLTSACHKLTTGGASSGLTVPNITASEIISSSCPVVNPGNSNATSNAFFSLMDSVKGNNNFSLYDKELVTPFPLLVTGWSSKGSKSSGGWADTRLLCIPRNQTISEGSRNVGVTGAGLGTATTSATGSGTTLSPTETKKPSAGNKALSVDVSMLSLVAVVGFGVLM